MPKGRRRTAPGKGPNDIAIFMALPSDQIAMGQRFRYLRSIDWKCSNEEQVRRPERQPAARMLCQCEV
jgi:hypothetical protein